MSVRSILHLEPFHSFFFRLLHILTVPVPIIFAKTKEEDVHTTKYNFSKRITAVLNNFPSLQKNLIMLSIRLEKSRLLRAKKCQLIEIQVAYIKNVEMSPFLKRCSQRGVWYSKVSAKEVYCISGEGEISQKCTLRT